MSGRKIRQWRAAQKRLATLPPCTCGAGIAKDEGEYYVITPHAMECPRLIAAARIGQHACSTCGYQYRVERVGRWRHSYCPRGHCHGVSLEQR